MMWPRKCPVCREELPERGNRRVRVPGRSGWALVHAGECFDLVDAQGMLELDRKPVPTSALARVRLRRLAELFGREDEGRKLFDELFPDFGAVARRLAGLDHPQGGGGAPDGSQGQLLGDEELVELRRIVHGGESSASLRTVRYARAYLRALARPARAYPRLEGSEAIAAARVSAILERGAPKSWLVHAEALRRMRLVEGGGSS